MNTLHRTIRQGRILAGFLAVAVLHAPLLAAAQEGSPEARPEPVPDAVAELNAMTAADSPRFGRAAGEILLVNGVVWTFDRFIREGGTNPVFRVGFNSWKDNLETGWTWDDNNFSTNQIAHPYHGSLYYNAARSNGYSYWQSIPFAFGGSLMWEYFGETHNAALNDWISTSIGGVALGEITHRLAKTVRDNTARGSSRNWREVGALFIDPVGSLNRIIDGDWSRVHANPADRYPDNYRTSMDLGFRTRGEENLWSTDTTDVYIKFEFDYGDPFFGDLGQPYDSFDFEIQLNFGDKTSVGRVQGSGNLAGVFVKETEKASHIVGAYHRYEYINTNALEFGGQAITGALLSRWEWDNGFELRSRAELGPLILGGVSSGYESVSGRSYDYGPGTAAILEFELIRNGWTWLELSSSHIWLHSISGNAADHQLASTRLRAALPVHANIGFGAEFVVVNVESRYRDYDDISQRSPQMRLFSSWGLN